MQHYCTLLYHLHIKNGLWETITTLLLHVYALVPTWLCPGPYINMLQFFYLYASHLYASESVYAFLCNSPLISMPQSLFPCPSLYITMSQSLHLYASVPTFLRLSPYIWMRQSIALYDTDLLWNTETLQETRSKFRLVNYANWQKITKRILE